MRLAAALLAVSLGAATPALATDWQVVATAVKTDGAHQDGVFLIDRDSIRVGGADTRAQMLLVDVTGSHAEAAMQFDCPGRRVRMLSGRMVANGVERHDTAGPWHDIGPETGTVYLRLLDYVCSGGVPKEGGFRQGFGSGDPVPAALAWLKQRLEK